MLLTDLTKGVCKCNLEAYDRLKAKLLSAQVLRIPTTGTPFHLHSDASGMAVRATLGQLDEQGVEHSLAFGSQKLSDAQMSWSTIEREAYAVIWVLNLVVTENRHTGFAV